MSHQILMRELIPKAVLNFITMIFIRIVRAPGRSPVGLNAINLRARMDASATLLMRVYYCYFVADARDDRSAFRSVFVQMHSRRGLWPRLVSR